MSFQHLGTKKYEEDGYFNSMLFLNLEKYNSMKKESIDSSELRLSIDLTGTPQTIQNCLSKDLLDQLDQSSPVKEHKRNDIEVDNMTLEDWTTDGSSFKNYSTFCFHRSGTIIHLIITSCQITIFFAKDLQETLCTWQDSMILHE